MELNDFWQSADLVKHLGEMRLSSGQTFSHSLRMDDVSLWDVVTPYLALYCLPKYISSQKQNLQLPWWRKAWDLYRSGAGRPRGEMLNRNPNDGIDCASWPESTSTMLFLNLVPQFYRETFQSVAEYLVMNHKVSLSILNIDSFSPFPRLNPAIQFHTMSGHTNLSVRKRIAQLSKELHHRTRVFRDDWSRIICSGRDLGWTTFRWDFNWLLYFEFPRLIRHIAIAEHLLDCHRPSLLISPDDADRGRVYSMLARARGIPSLVIQQGLGLDNAVEWRFFTADAVAVYGSTSRNALMQHGIPSEKIFITGCPRFDVLTQHSVQAIKENRDAMGIPEPNKLVVLASQPYVYGAFANPKIRREMLRAIGRAVKQVKGIYVVVKPHPGESEEEVRNLIGDSLCVSFVNRTLDIRNLIQACDVFMTFFSTSGLQALVAAKPMISVNFPGSFENNLYADAEAIWIARSSDQLVEYLRLLTGTGREQAISTRESARQNFVRNWTYLPDGQATKRIADLVLHLLN